MEGDQSSSRPRVLSSSRSNTPRPAPRALPPASATIRAARNLKRRSIGNLSRTTCTRAKKAGLSSSATPHHSVTRPLLDSMGTGRATLAVSGNQPRYLQATAASTRRAGATATTRPGTPQNLATTSRRSSSIQRVSAEEVAELKARIIQLEGENEKLKAESEFTKSQMALKDQNMELLQSQMALKDQNMELLQSQMALKDQNMELLQSSLESFKQTMAMKDTQLNSIQMALEAEKGVRMMKETEIAHLKAELCEIMEYNFRLTSQLAAKLDELREKDEEMRLLHNAVVEV